MEYFYKKKNIKQGAKDLYLLPKTKMIYNKKKIQQFR